MAGENPLSESALASTVSAMTKAGFVEHPEHPAYANIEALSHNGPYVVHGAWISPDGETWAHIEQNTAPPPDDFYNAAGERIVLPAVENPAVLVIENSQGGRVAARLNDLDMISKLFHPEKPYNFTDEPTYVEGEHTRQ